MSATNMKSDEDYASQYTGDFVSRWDELIDWDKRAAGEGSFFTDLLHGAGAHRIADVSTGSGFHAVQMKNAGFDVVAADGSITMINRARANFSQRDLRIPLYHRDWLQLSVEELGRFDAVLCLGSSLCHVFDYEVRLKVLARFRSLLAPGGLLIIDQRNFMAIRNGKYKSTGNYYYCGKSAKVEIGENSEQVCEFVYTFADGDSFRLRVCPILPTELRAEIAQSGFSYRSSYGDFSPTYEPMEADFVIHAATAI